MQNTVNNKGSKKMVIALICLVIALLVILGVVWRNMQITSEVQNMVVAEFTNSVSQEKVTVTFDNEKNTATANGNGFEQVEFAQTVSASGARYEHAETGMVLWNKGEELTIYDAEGKVLWATSPQEGIAEETPAINRAETRWMWKRTEMNNDTVILPRTEDAFTLVLRETENGAAFSGTTDCNSFSGAYTFNEDGTLSFGPVASTRMFCEGAQEQEFIDTLASTTGLYVAEDGVTRAFLLPYDSGSMIFEQIN